MSPSPLKIGLTTSLIEEDALTLINTVHQAIDTEKIPNAELAFIFCNRVRGENETTDRLLSSLPLGVPVINYSATQFRPDQRKAARQAEKLGEPQLINQWRDDYGKEVLKRLPPSDIDLLVGDMWIWGRSLCEARSGLNLHPALPWGPKGEWYRVIWDLIAQRAPETGVMLHKVTPELDRGPAITYCSFPLQTFTLQSLWDALPLDETALQLLMAQGLSEKEKCTQPLFRKIRELGFSREDILIIQTVKALAEGVLKLEGDSLADGKKAKVEGGFNLSEQVDKELLQISKNTIEGIPNNKERK